MPEAEEMIRQLVQGQEAVVRTARSIFPLLDKVSDEPTADLLTQRMQVHEKVTQPSRQLIVDRSIERARLRARPPAPTA